MAHFFAHVCRFLKVLCSVPLLLHAGAAQAEGKSPLPPGFETYLATVQKDWSIPGVAVAVVQGDRVTFSKGYGLRQWDRNERVDADTAFGVASVTKTFIAGAIAKLVDEEKLGFDDLVVDHLPDFALADPWITKHVTVRDLLGHRTGIDSLGDFWEEIPHMTETEALERAVFLGQIMPFRQRAKYNNIAYVILGQIIEKLSGLHWSDYLHAALWDPMQVENIYAQVDEFVPEQNIVPSGDGWLDSAEVGLGATKSGVNVAVPHTRWEAYFEGRISYDDREFENTISHYHSSVLDASQSVFSSANALAQWANLLLNDGVLGGRQILSRESVRELQKLTSILRPAVWADAPETAAHEEELSEFPYAEMGIIGFGLGQILYDYRGHRLIGHSGGELGFGALMLMDKRAKFAVVVMVNNGIRTYGSMDSIMNPIIDWHYGLPSQNWSLYYQKLNLKFHRQMLAEFKGFINSGNAEIAASVPVENLLGTYHHPAGGDVEIYLGEDGKQLRLTTGEGYELDLSHWQGDTFRGVVRSPLRLNALVSFGENQGDKMQTLHLRYVENPATDLVFKRRATE